MIGVVLHICAGGHSWTVQADGGVSPSWGYGGTSVTWPGYDPLTCPEPKRVAMGGLTPAYVCPSCRAKIHAGSCHGDRGIYGEECDPPPPVCLKPPAATFEWRDGNSRKKLPGGWFDITERQLTLEGAPIWEQPADAIRELVA